MLGVLDLAKSCSSFGVLRFSKCGSVLGVFDLEKSCSSFEVLRFPKCGASLAEFFGLSGSTAGTSLLGGDLKIQ